MKIVYEKTDVIEIYNFLVTHQGKEYHLEIEMDNREGCNVQYHLFAINESGRQSVPAEEEELLLELINEIIDGTKDLTTLGRGVWRLGT